jgi:hypothetical protein
VARSDSSKPKKEGTIAKFRQIYRYTKKGEPRIGWYMLAALLGPIILSVPVMFWLRNFVFPEVLGLTLGLILAMMILSRTADRVGYASVVGKPGAAGAILRAITQKKWSFDDQPVAMNPHTQDMIFRGVGRPGVVLVSEGPINRVRPLMEKEEKRVLRIIPNLKVIKIYQGEAEGQVPIRKLRKTVLRLRPSLTKAEFTQVKARIKALGGFNLPIPKGVDPLRARVSRKKLR